MPLFDRPKTIGRITHLHKPIIHENSIRFAFPKATDAVLRYPQLLSAEDLPYHHISWLQQKKFLYFLDLWKNWNLYTNYVEKSVDSVEN